jgi:putative sterol carrier protein
MCTSFRAAFDRRTAQKVTDVDSGNMTVGQRRVDAGYTPRVRQHSAQRGTSGQSAQSEGGTVAVKFLSDEWASEVKTLLQGNEQVKTSAGSLNARIQQVVTTPDGEKRYWFKLEGGDVDLGTGDIENPDATITQDYETAAALSKNELTGTAAYMSGKLRVSGDLMKLMQLQGVLGQLPSALKDLDVEY